MVNEAQKVDLLRLAGLPFFHGMPRWALARIDEMTPQFRAWAQEAVQLAGDEPA